MFEALFPQEAPAQVSGRATGVHHDAVRLTSRFAVPDFGFIRSMKGLLQLVYRVLACCLGFRVGFPSLGSCIKELPVFGTGPSFQKKLRLAFQKDTCHMSFEGVLLIDENYSGVSPAIGCLLRA